MHPRDFSQTGLSPSPIHRLSSSLDHPRLPCPFCTSPFLSLSFPTPSLTGPVAVLSLCVVAASPSHCPVPVLFVQAVCCGFVPRPRGFPPCEVPRHQPALTDLLSQSMASTINSMPAANSASGNAANPAAQNSGRPSLRPSASTKGSDGRRQSGSPADGGTRYAAILHPPDRFSPFCPRARTKHRFSSRGFSPFTLLGCERPVHVPRAGKLCCSPA